MLSLPGSTQFYQHPLRGAMRQVPPPTMRQMYRQGLMVEDELRQG